VSRIGFREPLHVPSLPTVNVNESGEATAILIPGLPGLVVSSREVSSCREKEERGAMHAARSDDEISIQEGASHTATIYLI